MYRLLKTNLHFLWLILFFVLHNYNEFQNHFSFRDVVVFSLIVTGFSFFLLISSRYFFKDSRKAGILTTVIIAVCLFFGAIQDALSSSSFTVNVAALEVLLLIFFIIILLLTVLLFIYKGALQKKILYLNLLFLLNILFELLRFIITNQTNTSGDNLQLAGFRKTNVSARPSVYLVILDDYTGISVLKKKFLFDNSAFYQSLAGKGFHIADSSFSNYKLTVLSMASMLNMDYIGSYRKLAENKNYSYKTALKEIKFNKVTHYLKQEGYKIINYSFFDFYEAPASVRNDLWGGNIRILINQTLYGRVMKNLPFFLARKKITSRLLNNLNDEYINQLNYSLNQSVINERQNLSGKNLPVFTYMHLNIPHAPYLFDSSGQRITENRNFESVGNNSAYIQYLIYCNKRILKWVDEIQEASDKKAVIIIMSDHGTYMPGAGGRVFENLNAVYIPGSNYSTWYSGVSNVNQFRLLFNELFGQELTIKPDITP